MTTDPLVIHEGGPPVTAVLSKDEYYALRGLDIATVTTTFETGVFEVVAGQKVGVATFGSRQVIVRPKITDLSRLIFLVGYAQNPRIWRPDLVHLDRDAELMPALADAFARITTRALEQGLLQGYKTVADTLLVLRGRILAGEQMSRRFGLAVPLAVEYDDFTVDIPENQLLALATLTLLRVPKISAPARNLLQRLRRDLIDVTVPALGSVLPLWQPSRLNIRYQPALRLADIVLAAESFEHRAGALTVTGYLFDMWRIFEDFITVALSESLARRGWRGQRHSPLFLDDTRKVNMCPDLACLRDGRTAAVVDAKYKAAQPDEFPNADLYQVLAYCTVLGVKAGHLVYAKGNNERVSSYPVQRSSITIHCHAVDLASQPQDVLRQVDLIVTKIIESAPAPETLAG